MRRGLPLLLTAALLVSAGAAANAGSVLVCSKFGEPPDPAAAPNASKVFPDELPRVGAIEKAMKRGRTRDGRTTLRLLALRVQFQPDSDPLSTGDGTFDYSDWDGATFDGPPHDREYFQLHMQALANYYSSVSHGRLAIEYSVAPEMDAGAFVLPHDMGYYHDYSAEQVWYVEQVERFTRDAFAVADSSGTIDFSEYDGYVLFHAGADWQSDIYYDTPYDLPSAHISLGDSISVNGGDWAVWDAAIMPETSSQDGLAFVLNGTLAHEVAHVLGLPDLYNTRNSFPAIGYWGIMDSGGSIGMNTPWGWAYGLIPAAPCAWSKEYMGWADPVVVLEDVEDVEVKASALRGEGERVYKIPVTGSEYFLVENRLDDIGGDGVVVIEQERGVVLGPVDPDCFEEICPVNHEYDYLLPGPGLLIYHIDDTRVIPGLMPYDAVNVDSDRRGVAVEEADGIVDLGNLSSFYWTGSAYDPFFAANNDSFSWDTFPSTDTNAGGKTFLSITSISDADSIMTMTIRFDRWKEGWPVDLEDVFAGAAPRVADIDGDGEGEVVAATGDGDVYAWNHDGTPVIASHRGGSGYFAHAAGGVSHAPALADLDEDGSAEVVVASDGGSLYVWTHVDQDGNGEADLHSYAYPVSLGGPAGSAPVAANLDAAFGLEVAVASRGGALSIVDHLGRHVSSSPHIFGHLSLDDVTIAAGDLSGDGLDDIALSTTNTGWVVVVDGDGMPLDGWPVAVAGWADDTAKVVLGDIDGAPDGFPEVVAAGSDGTVHVWNAVGEILPGWPVDVGAAVLGRPALGDLDGDGLLEIVAPAGADRVIALRSNGTRLENWPVELGPAGGSDPNTCSPVVGDIDGDGDNDVLLCGADGNIHALDGRSGEELPGWPLSSDPLSGGPWIGDIERDGGMDLLSAGAGGRVALFELPYTHADGAIVWSTEAGDASGSGRYPEWLMPDGFTETAGLIDPGLTYCYPNPARGDAMTVRIYLEESADIEVDVLDVTGQVVASFETEGLPAVNEVLWDVRDSASGLYIVRVKATEPGAAALQGETAPRGEVVFMKVAVLR